MTINTTRRPDRRRERTQRLLGDALLALILERNYDEIRIEDICHRADLGRATFYLHYTSKDELLFAVLERILSKTHTRDLAEVDPAQRGESLAQSVFSHIVTYRRLYRCLAQSAQSGIVDRQIRAFLEKITHSELQRQREQAGLDIAEHQLEFAVVYLASALHGIMMWAATLEGEIDVDALSRQYLTFTHAGFRALIAN